MHFFSFSKFLSPWIQFYGLCFFASSWKNVFIKLCSLTVESLSLLIHSFNEYLLNASSVNASLIHREACRNKDVSAIIRIFQSFCWGSESLPCLRIESQMKNKQQSQYCVFTVNNYCSSLSKACTILMMETGFRHNNPRAHLSQVH